MAMTIPTAAALAAIICLIGCAAAAILHRLWSIHALSCIVPQSFCVLCECFSIVFSLVLTLQRFTTCCIYIKLNVSEFNCIKLINTYTITIIAYDHNINSNDQASLFSRSQHHFVNGGHICECVRLMPYYLCVCAPQNHCTRCTLFIFDEPLLRFAFRSRNS